MSLLNQLGALGNSQSEYEYRRMMMEVMAQQQYMAPASLSAASLNPVEPSPVLLLLPRKAT